MQKAIYTAYICKVPGMVGLVCYFTEVTTKLPFIKLLSPYEKTIWILTRIHRGEQQCWTSPAWSVFPQQPHSWGFSLLFVGPQVTCAVLTDLLVPDTRRGHWYSSHFLAQAVTTSAKDARPQEGLKVSSQSMASLLRQVTTKPIDLHSSWYLSGQRVRHDD